jgi:tRNA(Ile)-lysidine synthetase-like protein
VRVRGHEVEFGHIEAALDAGKRRVSLPGAEVERSFDWVRIAAPGAGRDAYRVVVEGVGEMAGPWGRISVGGGVYNQGGSSLKDLFAGALILRNWRPGDAYRPAAAARPVKLKDLFQRARIPSWQRPSWPVLTKGEEILWAKQFGPAEGFPLEIRFRENDGG